MSGGLVDFEGVPAVTPPAIDTDKWADVNSMNESELRAELIIVRERLCELDQTNRKLTRMLHACVEKFGQVQCTMETEQERVVNQLIRQIDEIRAREQTTIQQMEAEQEKLAISFMKRIEDMRKEREQIVNSMEFESEAAVNKAFQISALQEKNEEDGKLDSSK